MENQETLGLVLLPIDSPLYKKQEYKTAPGKSTEIKQGSKLWFAELKGQYEVRLYDGIRYAICTQPLNFRRTVMYTIIDFQMEIRGTNDLVFNMYDYKKDEDISKCMEDLQLGKIEISHRNRCGINITKIA